GRKPKRGVWGEAERVPPAKKTTKCGRPRLPRRSRLAQTTSWWGGPSRPRKIPERRPKPCSRSSADDGTRDPCPLREDRRPHAWPLSPDFGPALGNLPAVSAGLAVPGVRRHARR